MVAAIVLLHLGLALLLQRAMQPASPAPLHEAAPALLWLVPPAPPKAPTQPARPTPSVAKAADNPPPARPQARTEPAKARPVTTDSEPTLTLVTPPPAVEAASSPATPALPAERLIDSLATRNAIRQTGQQALLHERAAEATGIPIERTDTALAQQVAEASTPDCLRDPKAATGKIGPIGLGGILGLPFLAARIATGKCAK